MINAHDYSYITCIDSHQGRRISELGNKLIHNNDVEFYLQSLQITYPNSEFMVHKCRP